MEVNKIQIILHLITEIFAILMLPWVYYIAKNNSNLHQCISYLYIITILFVDGFLIIKWIKELLSKTKHEISNVHIIVQVITELLGVIAVLWFILITQNDSNIHKYLAYLWGAAVALIDGGFLINWLVRILIFNTPCFFCPTPPIGMKTF
jgi:hypothetical protein